MAVGVCGAIYDEAGIEQMEIYCHNKWIRDMEVNEIRITPRICIIKRNHSYLCTNIYTRSKTYRKTQR